MKIVPYKPTSKSAEKLSLTLSEESNKVIRRGDPERRSLNINWGNGYLQDGKFLWLNKPSAVRKSIDKLTCFKELKDVVPTVPYTTSKETAKGWLRENYQVLARTREGMDGSGITIISPHEELPQANLYTKFLENRKEFRVYVFDGQVFHKQERRRKNSAQPARIWSSKNGYILCNKNVNPPPEIDGMALSVVDILGLDFAAVDFLQQENDLYFLETNTAVSLTDDLAKKYAELILKL